MERRFAQCSAYRTGARLRCLLHGQVTTGVRTPPLCPANGQQSLAGVCLPGPTIRSKTSPPGLVYQVLLYVQRLRHLVLFARFYYVQRLRHLLLFARFYSTFKDFATCSCLPGSTFKDFARRWSCLPGPTIRSKTSPFVCIHTRARRPGFDVDSV